MNRIVDAIIKRRAELERRVKPDGSPITGDLALVEAGMSNTLDEVVQYQQLKSEAYLRGLLNVEEAQTIYIALGCETPGPDGWGETADLATKVIVTSLMGELVAMKLARVQSQPESAKTSHARA